MYAGCVSGAINKSDYLEIQTDAGFVNINIQKEKQILLPKEVVNKFLSEAEVSEFKEKGLGIYSITVFAERPDADC